MGRPADGRASQPLRHAAGRVAGLPDGRPGNSLAQGVGAPQVVVRQHDRALRRSPRRASGNYRRRRTLSLRGWGSMTTPDDLVAGLHVKARPRPEGVRPGSQTGAEGRLRWVFGFKLSGRQLGDLAYCERPNLASNCSAGMAPTTAIGCCPGRKKAIVGSVMIWRACETPGLASTSILTTSIESPYFWASFSSSGATIRHGPHQAAQKSTITGRCALRTTSSKVSSVTALTSAIGRWSFLSNYLGRHGPDSRCLGRHGSDSRGLNRRKGAAGD